MKEYAPEAIRNVVLAGHAGSGKTALAEACLFLAGATDRQGRVEDGNTVSDFLPDEVKRGSSIHASLLAFEYSDTKFNLMDAPGYADFFGEVCSAMTAAEDCVLVANAAEELELGIEAGLDRARDNGLGTFVFINGMDRDRANFERLLQAIRGKLHLPAVVLTYPLGAESGFRGYVDVIHQKAYEERGNKRTEIPIPDEVAGRIQELRIALIENDVECDDALMEKYLESGELTEDENTALLKLCVANRHAIPIVCGSATKGIGISFLLETLKDYGASPLDTPHKILNENGEAQPIVADANAPFAGYVFKTFSDPHTGRQTFIKVVTGTLRRDADIINLDGGHHEKLAHLYSSLGKKQTEVAVANAGDIVLVTKLKGTTSGQSLAATPDAPRFKPVEYPESLYTVAIEPATPGSDDKMADALHKLCEEDRTLRVERRKNGQIVLSGLGDVHLQTAVARLKSAFGVEVRLSEPKVEYLETVRKLVKAEGKLKKQSGGHGQFADVFLEIAPGEPGSGFTFEDKIVGGVVPRAFIPAVEEGVREALHEGPIAGCPLVDLKVTLFDGKYHDVDSSYQTFKIAGNMALRNGTKDASPALLEPVLEVTVAVPEATAGDVVGDLNGRRGHILGMEPDGDGTVRVSAYVPEAEMLKYAITLRSLTRGRGRFSRRFDHYSAVAENVARQIAEAHTPHRSGTAH
jgi:elongation factor G